MYNDDKLEEIEKLINNFLDAHSLTTYPSKEECVTLIGEIKEIIDQDDN